MTSGFDLRADMMQHLPHLRAFARTLTGNRERADDLVQDTIIRALNAEQQFAEGTNLKAWLMTILRNHYINGLRRLRFEGDSIEDVPDSALATPAVQDDKIELQDVSLALMKMSPEHREVLILISATGLSYEETAEICGCAIGTVKSRLNRARLELKKLVDA
jgi:RNA polymerase sigma-70 factor (ECF subfamily)